MRMLSKRIRLLVVGTAAALFAYVAYSNKSIDVLSVHVGKPYEEVVRDSTFSVHAKTAVYPSEPPHPSSTWISSPVVIRFDDPQYGFTLPPTKFGAVTYNKSKVATITTSPMLETLAFEDLSPLLDKMQIMLKAAGWTPRDANSHAWLETTNEADRNALQSKLFDQVVIVLLLIPHKYTLALNVKCYARCDERNPKTAKYLIDVSVGSDYYSE
ncbi:hypothetical protein [Pseudomonas sp. UMAB-40]|uniref:hypothetical protein n=1 Tax=Pseudomonas sp. UMAB-40 TaxID=1365407 RepID=UPI001C566C79|nr:hypothetical protein [Pseudomonas sp. UMAB-40]